MRELKKFVFNIINPVLDKLKSNKVNYENQKPKAKHLELMARA